jgi:hypothetical protein
MSDIPEMHRLRPNWAVPHLLEAALGGCLDLCLCCSFYPANGLSESGSHGLECLRLEKAESCALGHDEEMMPDGVSGEQRDWHTSEGGGGKCADGRVLKLTVDSSLPTVEEAWGTLQGAGSRVRSEGLACGLPSVEAQRQRELVAQTH